MDVQQLIRKLKKEAECPLCLDTVHEPKTLPCLHSFCLQCLDKLASVERRKLKTTVDCPVCRTSFPIPEGDSFVKLPTPFYLNQLVDVLALGDDSAEAQKCSNCEEKNAAICYCFVCQHFLCAACFDAHQRMKANRGHRNVLIENLQTQDVEELIRRPVMCGQNFHQQEAIEYYCQDCRVCICQKCAVVSHNRHKIVDIEEEAEQRKLLIMEDAEKVKAQAAVRESKTKKEAEWLTERREEVAAARREVRATTNRIKEIVDDNEAAILAELDHINETLEGDGATRTDSSELLTTQLRSSGEYGEAITQRNISAEIVQTQSDYHKRCEDLTTANIEMKDHKLPHINFVTNAEQTIENMLRLFTLGRVVVSHTDPLQCLAKGNGLKEAVVGQVSNFTVTTRDFEGKQIYCDNDVIALEIRTNEDNVEKKIENHKNGNYTLGYKPISVGQHNVLIRVNGKPLAGSPWRAQVNPHQYKTLFTFGSRGRGQGQFNFPCDIAVSKRTGNIAVADCCNKRIQMFSSEGEFLREFGQKGPGAQRIRELTSVAFSRSGEVIVLHSGKISLFTESGQFIKHIVNEQLQKPWKMSVRGDGQLIVTEEGDKAIKVLSSDGTKLLKCFRDPGCDSLPSFGFFHQDRFFVSYGLANCVKVLSEEGVFLYNIGTMGTCHGQLNNPCGVTINMFNNLMVCDGHNNRLQEFTQDGKFLNEITIQIPYRGSPFAVADSDDGRLYVTDVRNNCVHVVK